MVPNKITTVLIDNINICWSELYFYKNAATVVWNLMDYCVLVFISPNLIDLSF